jgi:L-ascorbate metabolism protein UlaG (beta-lactamase superfamily)
MADDLPGLARALDAPVRAPAWWSTVTLGDVEVDVLPFHGEQATRRLPAVRPELQSRGNCYRLQLPGYSVVLRVDAGADARGEMVDVLRRSVAERGPIDVVMSCCFESPEAIDPGLAHDALAVPFAELERLRRAGRESMTLGPDGVVAACEAAQARFFMPYAHGYNGLRAPAGNPDGAGTEAQILARIGAGLDARGLDTQIVPWNPGDVMDWHACPPVVRGGIG